MTRCCPDYSGKCQFAMDLSTYIHNLNFQTYIVHFFAFIMFFYVLVCLCSKKAPIVFKDKLHKVIFFTAHPDDECMFFVPTILYYLQQGSIVHLTCFSNGNFYGLAEVRRKELQKSCQVLGIDKENLQILNDSRFPDNPSTVWDVEEVSDVMLEAANTTQADIIVTFDSGGVSGHRNHISLYDAARNLVERNRLNKDIKVLVLKTTSIFRKYLFWMDLPLSYLTADFVTVSSVTNYVTGWVEWIWAVMLMSAVSSMRQIVSFKGNAETLDTDGMVPMAVSNVF